MESRLAAGRAGIRRTKAGLGGAGLLGGVKRAALLKGAATGYGASGGDSIGALTPSAPGVQVSACDRLVRAFAALAVLMQAG